jgi:phosphoribosylanthranilate isomerase
MTHVKICGIRSVTDARCAIEAGAAFIGLVFAESPRRVDASQARAIRDHTGAEVQRVGVFVDAAAADVEQAIANAGLAYVQFHGAESPRYCAAQPVPVIKAFRVGADPVESILSDYAVAAFLADTHVAGAAGGTGRSFDWRPATAWARRQRLFLAGGLTPENVGHAIRMVRPFAVDVSSGVERAPGVKDPERVRRFVEAVRAADRECGEEKP